MALRALTSLTLPAIFVAYNAVQGFLRNDMEVPQPLQQQEPVKDMRGEVRHSVLVNISTGLIQGFSETSRNGRTFYQFLGVPYAQPPVGSLRFEAPMPAQKWSGVLVTEKHQEPCLQLNFITGLLKGSEDCLYLNVFTPKEVGFNSTRQPPLRTPRMAENPSSKSPLMPVMVFIYGGYFMYGAAHHYGPQYFMDQDVVLVTFNYRVGALGFLNTGDGVVRGNMGLKDQNLVLKWVQENIHHFGGDAKRVTLFGESAGGSSVHLHILSPMSAGLFQKAISQSGTAIRTFQIVPNPGEQARRLGKILHCPSQSTTAMVSCLKTLEGSEIVDAHINRIAKLRVFQDPLSSSLAQYAPSIETVVDNDTFLAQSPMVILKSGNFSHVPWICGVNSEEGLIYSARITRNKNVVSRISRDWKNVAPILLNYDENRWEVADRVKKFYLPRRYFGLVNTATDFNRYFQEFTNMFSDRLYNTAAHVSIREHAKHAPVYAYYFSYLGEFTFYNLFKSSGTYPRIVELSYTLASKWITETIFRRKRARYGICHGDDLPMFFNLNLLSTIEKTDQDYSMSQMMTAAWVQFAYDHTRLRFQRYGWPPVNPKDVSPVYMNFSDTNPTLIREPFTERVEFWKELDLVG